jgi:hypothetical protein
MYGMYVTSMGRPHRFRRATTIAVEPVLNRDSDYVFSGGDPSLFSWVVGFRDRRSGVACATDASTIAAIAARASGGRPAHALMIRAKSVGNRHVSLGNCWARAPLMNLNPLRDRNLRRLDCGIIIRVSGVRVPPPLLHIPPSIAGRKTILPRHLGLWTTESSAMRYCGSREYSMS